MTVSALAGAVEVVVCDQGAGLDEQQLDQLFQPFNRVGAEDSKVEGSGLGLVIARSRRPSALHSSAATQLGAGGAGASTKPSPSTPARASVPPPAVSRS